MAKHDPFVEDPFDDDEALIDDADEAGEAGEDDDRVEARRDRKLRGREPLVVHADDAVVVIDKPPGVALLTRDGGAAALHDVTVDADFDLPGEAFTVHPMDNDASGLLVLARTPAVRDALRAQISAGQLDLVHHALVQAVMPRESGTIKAGIRVIAEHTGRVRVDSGGSPATTEWRTLDTFVNFALLECRPRSIEPCQIRAHLEHAGMPLAVDKIYGGAQHLMLSSFKAGYRRSRRRPEKPLIERLSLHSASLVMTHPTTGKAHTFESPPPRDFKAAVHQLGRFGRIPKASTPRPGR